MDVVGAVMRELHLSAAGYRRLELCAPWAVSFSQAGLRGIHIVLKAAARSPSITGRHSSLSKAT